MPSATIPAYEALAASATTSTADTSIVTLDIDHAGNGADRFLGFPGRAFGRAVH